LLWGQAPQAGAVPAAPEPPSAHAPMNGVPVANENEDKQKESNQQ
jgi:hypothetical protein